MNLDRRTSKYWKKPLDTLKNSSASVKFISFEPLLGGVLPEDLKDIDWAIIGAQTGIGAKNVDPHIVNMVIDLIKSNDIPLFVKPNLRLQIPQNSKSDWVLREEFPKPLYKTRAMIEV